MKKEWLLSAAVVIGTLFISLLLFRWLAPGLLGIPADLQLVRVSKTLPPFYEVVFNADDMKSTRFLLQDPRTRVRAKPLLPNFIVMGPNDILGFRNHAVPNIADVVAIGDSQTYGNNATLDENWPSHMQRILKAGNHTVYSMATGGWGAVQYLDMFMKSPLFEPRVVIIAFYTGNDPLESFQMAYGLERWEMLRPDPALDSSDAPAISFPAPENEWWQVTFKDGVQTIFTPTLRLGSNQEHPAVRAGYAIMADVASKISDIANTHSIQLIFTIIPTKELVYALKVRQDKLEPPTDYITLLENEQRNIEQLSSTFQQLPNVKYIDVVKPLQLAALGNTALYPQDINGHPVAEGYKVIGNTLARAVTDYLPPRPQGLVAIKQTENNIIFALIREDGVWPFSSPALIAENGWQSGDVPVIQMRDIAGLRWHTAITTIDPERFGPSPMARQGALDPEPAQEK